ncbi:PREDICTED: nuclear pore complex protein GP210-like [Prunus mume]|uniref:Nuclear pore complex protein GP210-like n=1 Tax=Prunus mume TaxID=102107 RepID=A0ABM0NVJ2_PRUMU|nr:PREDICTED: nuclear pore complex protein GP210-like [Prunus mume]XP_016649252.1 PREDICTED: nuclear pore complex protein GP210-like [Prunus mume]XP_016649253.1 PREDICTED: nuclear pore complex protein GP210-like [Prunus mume]
MVMLLNFHVETVVGTHLQAAVTMKASNGAYFYRCDAFSSFIKWKAGSESFFIVNATGESPALDSLGNADFHASNYGPPFSWAYIYASASGRATLHATLSKEYHYFDSSSGGPIVLKASSLIVAYSPLSIRQGGDGKHFSGYFFDLALAETDKQLVKLGKIYLVPALGCIWMMCFLVDLKSGTMVLTLLKLWKSKMNNMVTLTMVLPRKGYLKALRVCTEFHAKCWEPIKLFSNTVIWLGMAILCLQ